MKIESLTAYTAFGNYTAMPSYPTVEFESLHQIALFLATRIKIEFTYVKSLFVCIDNGRCMTITSCGFTLVYNHQFNDYELDIINKNEVKFKNS